MRVLAACSLGGAGHLGPLFPFLAAARQRGDEVLVAGAPTLRELVEEQGYPFRGGGEPNEVEVAAIRERLPVVSAAEGSMLANRELFGRLATAAMLPGMDRSCAEWAPDLMVREPCEYSSAIVAGRLGIPTATVAISSAEVEAGSIAAARPALEAHQEGLADALIELPYLTRFPASIDPSPFPLTLRYREPTASALAALPRWWNRPDGPLVYVSFGTVLGSMSLAADVYRAALAAVSHLDARVLLSVGRRFEVAALGSVPANVHIERWLDQAVVMALADLVVCHGGSGTILAALAAGVPIVVVPLFADQRANGRAIAGMGAGVLLDSDPVGSGRPRQQFGARNASRLAEGIAVVLEDPAFKRCAGSAAREMAAAQTVDELLTSYPPRN